MKAPWASGEAYEPYIGRWSRRVAAEFVRWLDCLAEASWLDVGCGTGALAATVLENAAPRRVVGADPSEGFVAYAREHVPAAEFHVAGAEELPFGDGEFDAVVSGLMLNFLADPAAGVGEMARVARSGGVVATYLWDYSGEMQMLRCFWDAACELDPQARPLDEGERFPLCDSERLQQLFTGAGLGQVATRAIDVPTRFRDFGDFWQPFLGGQGPAPAYCASLDGKSLERLRDSLRERLPVAPDGSIDLIARAWAVRGRA